jgi:hypothetical protein
MRMLWDSTTLELAAEVLRAAADGEGARAIMHAVTLATRVTNAAAREAGLAEAKGQPRRDRS